MASEVLATKAGTNFDVLHVYPPLGLKNPDGNNNCWLNSAFQVVCNLSYLKDAVLNRKQPTSSEMEAAASKAHMFIVAGYILIGLGAVLAAGLLYIAFVASPLLAICAPIVPIFLGVLCYSHGQSQQLENPFNLLINMVKKYDTERQTALAGSVSSIDTQSLREWLFHATFKPNTPLSMQPIQHPHGSQEDPINFFLYLFNALNLFIPAVKIEWTHYNAANEPLGTSVKVHLPNTFLKLDIPQVENQSDLSFDELLKHNWQENIEAHKQSYPTAAYSRIDQSFVSFPHHLTILFTRNFASSTREGELSFDPLIKTPITGLDHYHVQPPFFPGKAEYETDAFIVHIGSQYGGHYVAYVRDKEGNWWLLNDDASKIVPLEEAMDKLKQCYLAFMSKKTATSTE